jgi:hypothetical protein
MAKLRTAIFYCATIAWLHIPALFLHIQSHYMHYVIC